MSPLVFHDFILQFKTIAALKCNFNSENEVIFASGSQAHIQERQHIVLADTWNALEQSDIR